MDKGGFVRLVICAREYIERRNKENDSHFSDAQELIKSKYSLHQQDQKTASTSHFPLIYILMYLNITELKKTCIIAPGSMSPYKQHACTHRIAVSCAGK